MQQQKECCERWCATRFVLVARDVYGFGHEAQDVGVSGQEAQDVGVSGQEAQDVGVSGQEAQDVGVSGQEAPVVVSHFFPFYFFDYY